MTSHLVRVRLELLHVSLGDCMRRSITVTWSDDVSTNVHSSSDIDRVLCRDSPAHLPACEALITAARGH
jgi:hypothetical protein